MTESSEAISKIREAAERAALPFTELGLGTDIEMFCYDARLRETDAEKARYISAILTVNLPDSEGKIHEYSLNVGCDATRRGVSEESLDKAILDFDEECRRVYDMLSESEDKLAVIDELFAVGEAEYEKLIKKLNHIKNILIIGSIIAIVIIVVLNIL